MNSLTSLQSELTSLVCSRVSCSKLPVLWGKRLQYACMCASGLAIHKSPTKQLPCAVHSPSSYKQLHRPAVAYHVELRPLWRAWQLSLCTRRRSAEDYGRRGRFVQPLDGRAEAANPRFSSGPSRVRAQRRGENMDTLSTLAYKPALPPSLRLSLPP